MFLIDYENTVFQELLRSVLTWLWLACPPLFVLRSNSPVALRQGWTGAAQHAGGAAGVRYGLGDCLPRRSSLTSTPPTISTAPRMASPGSRSPAMRPTMPAQTGSLA